MKKTSFFIFALLMLLTVTACTNNTASSENTANTTNTNTTLTETSTEAQGNYVDGVYTGTGVGYAGGLKMQVTVENGYITAVECLSHNEVGKQYYEAAFENVPALIIKKQGTEDIDAVSGSTMTTKGIIKAVERALKNATK